MKYDVVLILGNCRSAAPYLSVVQRLGREFRIGVMPARIDAATASKAGSSQVVFLELCRQMGAELVSQGDRLETRLMVVQQFPYPEDTVAEIRSSVRADRTVGLLGLTLAGLAAQDAFLEQFEIRKAYVPNKRLFEFLLDRRAAGGTYERVDVEQVGLPFDRHPVFPDFSADYLIAVPTGFSFRKEREKHWFLETVLRLLEQIPDTDLVVYKPHNAMSRDYLTPRAYAAVGGPIAGVRGVSPALRVLAKVSPRWLRRHLDQLRTATLHSLVMKRTRSMDELTPYANLAMEAFLPGVRKGVIGGLSNTIWGTLYFGLPFYNCVNPDARAGSGVNELLPHKDSSNYLDLNLEFFGVDYCGGDLAGGALADGIVSEADHAGDLVDSILYDVGAVRA